MNEATKQSIMSAIRSILIAVGAMLSTKGYADDETVQAAIGVVMVVLPAIWGVIDKVRAERATAAREVIAVNAGIIKADATRGTTPMASPGTAPEIIAAAGPAADTSKGKP